MRKIQQLSILLFALLCSGLYAQEENPFLSYEAPSQNLIKFNRFLINPTFSTVREDKSYINLFHRNQSVSFDDNNQTYYLSYSGRIGDRSGLGLSLYTQREGLFNNLGLLANYAYGIKLSEKSNFTFGANFSYYTSGFNQDRANTLDPNDPILNSLDDSSLISFQPGFNISYGQFDFGLFAENLFDYNLKTSESNTEFNEKTYSGHLQYTHQFKNGKGIFESGRLMPLARVKRVGEEGYTLGGNLILDLPKLGWLQAGYDDFYGAAAGIGFNLSKHISLGYTIEKAVNNNLQNFGATHEISLAYSFTPNLTEDRVMLEKDNEDLVVNDEDQEVEEISLTEKDALIADLQQKLAENDAILDELLLRQDSIEKGRQADLERRFNMVMRMVQRETNNNPNLKEKARKAYFEDSDSIGIANNYKPNDPVSNQGITSTASTKRVISLKNNTKKSLVANNETKPNNTVKDKIYMPKTVKPSKKINSGLKAFNIPAVESGYYIVANVYNGKKYMSRFMEDLESQGIDADYIENPKNGRKYVYLKKFSSKQEAMNAYASKMDGAYTNDMWVMKVKGTDNSYDRDIASNNDSSYGSNTLQKNIVKNNGQNPSGVSAKTYRLNGIGSGYYIIANVFANTSNANRFVKQLNAQGLNASYFVNPENNYKYVYLKKHETWNNALISYYTKLNSAYDDKMWIMRVKPNSLS
ncbi:hypothetical protein MTsPCn9_15650 [Croceitalea sp. MTPC9]|uniref:PorP/SprF family type IX secretion system membrane protein n=1 Tax=unclassified Croceitalea TaxID=2632280 RepID=UPI002B3F77C4|nr:hypothetical protein MTsPCn6_13480 [Croceitalea sp. MTPC6]GMN16629.1 hypothetical protein MTsPCn9_15650 [Croceitalea sp. MTPC9]